MTSNSLPGESEIAEFPALHQGNHGDRGDPHPQYRFPLVRTGGQPNGTDLWLPVIDREFALDAAAELKWKGFDLSFLFHDGRTDQVDQPAGLVRIQFHLRSDKTFHCGASFQPMGVKYHAQKVITRYTFGEDLIRLYVTTINASTGVYRLRAYMRGTGAGCLYWIKPIHLFQDGNVYTNAAFTSPWMLTNFRTLVQDVDYLLLKQATPAAAGSLPAEDANTKLIRSSTERDTAVLSALPPASAFWQGKVAIVWSNNFGDVAYQCVETGTVDAYRWDVCRPVYGAAPPTLGTWAVGNRVRNAAPSVLGTAGSQYVVDGWVCTVAGTPGTWVACRTLTGT